MVYLDVMMLIKSGKFFLVIFIFGIMYIVWGIFYVFLGWLILFNYIKVGREIFGCFKIRLIVFYSEG